MKLLSLLTTAALTLPSTLAISTQLLKNYCNETLYVTLVLGNGQTEDGKSVPPTHPQFPPSDTPSHPHTFNPLRLHEQAKADPMLSSANLGPFELPPSEAFIHPINGTGNAAKIGFQPAIFDPNVGVFIFGTSISNGDLFW